VAIIQLQCRVELEQSSEVLRKIDSTRNSKWGADAIWAVVSLLGAAGIITEDENWPWDDGSDSDGHFAASSVSM
jgi:hypothetical protein